MARYRLTPKARAGFIDIIEYVDERFGTLVAEDVLKRITAAFELISENPGVGHVREDVTTDTRIKFWSVGPTVIAYRTDNRSVEILFVERGERDWERLIEDASDD